jgi:hypothetical protein
VIIAKTSALSFAAAVGELCWWISDCTLELLMVLWSRIALQSTAAVAAYRASQTHRIWPQS